MRLKVYFCRENNKQMNQFCSWLGVVHSYPVNKFMGCSLIISTDKAARNFNRG